MFKEKNDRLICSLAAGILLALIEWFVYKNLWVTAGCLIGGTGLFYLISTLIGKRKAANNGFRAAPCRRPYKQEKTIMTEEDRMLAGMLYTPHDPELEALKKRGHRLSAAFNALTEDDAEERQAILKEVLGSVGERNNFLGPVHFHYGKHTKIGSHCFFNFNITIQDDGPVTIGDRCSFGPNVTIATPGHPLLPEERRGIVCKDGVTRYVCYAKPVTIGNDCWFGANVTVLPGVTIGDGCVIGAGSVVTRDIPPRCIAVGVPARVLRKITEADRIENSFPEYR